MFGVSDLNTLDAPLPSPGKAKPSLEGPVPKDHRYSDFVEATDTIQNAVLERRPWGNLWPLREIFKDVSAIANRTVDKFVEPLIHRAMDAKAKRGDGEIDMNEGSFLDHLVCSTNDKRLVRDEVSLVFHFGRTYFDL